MLNVYLYIHNRIPYNKLLSIRVVICRINQSLIPLPYKSQITKSSRCKRTLLDVTTDEMVPPLL